jgi:hypothetical protein
VNLGGPLNRADGVSFHQEAKRQEGLIHRHEHSIKRAFVGFGESLLALLAAVALQAITVFAKLLGFDPAIVARHGESP